MALNTGITWAHHTLNLWWGCVEVSPGCDNCYAREWAKKCGRHVWGVHAPRWFTKNWRSTLAKAEKIGLETGERQRVFLQSMSDIAEILPGDHPDRAEMDAVRQAFFEDVIPTLTMVDILMLTKRIGNVPKIVPASWMDGHWPAHVWMGITAVNQEEFDRDWPKLKSIPAAIRWISWEPSIGPLAVDPDDCPDWVIGGGESGSPDKVRSMDLSWACETAALVRHAGKAFFMKQLGRKPIHKGEPYPVADSHGKEMATWPNFLRVQEFPALSPTKESETAKGGE